MKVPEEVISPMVLIPENIANLQDVIDILTVSDIVLDGASNQFYKVSHLCRVGIPDGEGGVS